MSTLPSASSCTREDVKAAPPARSNSLLANWLTPTVFSGFFGAKTQEHNEVRATASPHDEVEELEPECSVQDEERSYSQQWNEPSPTKPGSEEGKALNQRSSRIRYSIARPPPVVGPRRILHTKPKLLLQLQRLTSSGRQRPVFDVVPVQNLTGKSARKLPESVHVRLSGSGNSLAIVRSGDYSNREWHDANGAADASLEHAVWELSHVLGVITSQDGSNVEGTATTLHDNTTWIAQRLPNGNYEFKCDAKSDACATFRWILRNSNEEVKYKFTVIDPRSRKHPILATLNRHELRIYDSYKLPPSAGNTPETSPDLVQHADDPFFQSNSPPDSQFVAGSLLRGADDYLCTTTDRMQQLIILTAICLATKEIWPNSMKSSASQRSIHSDLSRSSSMSRRPDSLNDLNISQKASSPIRSPSFTKSLLASSHKSTKSVSTALDGEYAISAHESLPTRDDVADQIPQTRRSSFQWLGRKTPQTTSQTGHLEESQDEGLISQQRLNHRRRSLGPGVSMTKSEPESQRNVLHSEVTEVTEVHNSAAKGADRSSRRKSELRQRDDSEQRNDSMLTAGMRRLMRKK